MTRFLTALTLAAALPALAAQAAEPLPPAGDPTAAQIRTLVSSIPLAVDRAAYDLTEAAFADEIVIDYTSLWGGTPATMTPEQMMTAWRGIVPGFDATWHELGQVTVSVDGNTATATAQVDGRHWIDGDLWRPIGTYHWDVAEVGGACLACHAHGVRHDARDWRPGAGPNRDGPGGSAELSVCAARHLA